MKRIFAIIIIGLLFSMSLYAEQFGKISVNKPEAKKQVAIPAINSVGEIDLIYLCLQHATHTLRSNEPECSERQHTQNLKLPGITGNNEGGGSPGGFYMYITFEDITDRIPQDRLEKLCKVTGTALTDKVNEIIGRAESKVDGYAAAKYSLPLPVSPLLGDWALALAEHELYKLGVGGSVQEKIRLAYEDTMKELRDLAAGKISLPVGDDDTVPEQKVGAAIKVASNTQIMDDSIYGS